MADLIKIELTNGKVSKVSQGERDLEEGTEWESYEAGTPTDPNDEIRANPESVMTEEK